MYKRNVFELIGIFDALEQKGALFNEKQLENSTISRVFSGHFFNQTASYIGFYLGER